MNRKTLLLILSFFILVGAGYVPGKQVYDYFMEVRKDNVVGQDSGDLVGYDSELANGTEQTVWPEGTVYSFLSSAITLNVISDSPLDTATGTGAYNVKISYLDSSYDPQTEVVTLTGQTSTATTGSMLRINDIEVMDAGSNESNVGNIYVGDGAVAASKFANVYGVISAGDSKSRTAVYTVPNGKILYVHDINFLGSTTKAYEAWLDVRRGDDNAPWEKLYYVFGGDAPSVIPELVNGGFTATTDIRVEAIASGANTALSVFGDFLLINEGDTGRKDQ